jgi:hypothetical protein
MKAGIRNLVTKRPLSRPISVATPRQKSVMGRTKASCPSMRFAARTDMSAMTAATERSIPPVRITKVCPTVATPNEEACLRRLTMLRGLRNTGEARADAKIRIARITQIAAWVATDRNRTGLAPGTFIRRPLVPDAGLSASGTAAGGSVRACWLIFSLRPAAPLTLFSGTRLPGRVRAVDYQHMSGDIR